MIETQPIPPKPTVPWWQRWLPVLLAIAAVALAVRGQQIFNEKVEVLRFNAMLYFGGATIAFLVASALASPIPFIRRRDATSNAIPSTFPLWRVLLGIASLVFLGGVLYTLSQTVRTTPQDTYSGLAWRWLAAIIAMGMAWCPPLKLSLWWAKFRAMVRAHRLEITLAVGILLLGGVLRLWNLGTVPDHLNGDEASIGVDIQRIVSGEIGNPFGLMWGPLPTLSGFVMSWFYTLLGQDIFALRFPNALAGTLAIFALYLFARTFVRREVALGAALLLAVMPLHIHYSRIAVGVIWDSFTFTAALAAFWWAMNRKGENIHPFLIAGLIGGLGQYGYSGSRLLPLMIGGMVAYFAVFYPRVLREKWVGLVGMAVLFAVIASPLYLHAYRYPDDFNARFNQTGIFQSGYVDQTKAATGVSTTDILIEQVRLSLFGFAYIGDTSETWGTAKPLVPVLFSLPLFLGLILSLRRWRDPTTVLLHGWFWAVIIGAGALTTNPPASNRMVSVLSVVALFAALGWEAVAAALVPDGIGSRLQRQTRRLVLSGLVIVTAVFGVIEYQATLNNNFYGGVNTKIATMIGQDLHIQPEGTSLVMIGAPRVYADMSPIQFLTPGRARVDITEPIAALPTNLPAGRLYVVALPERISDLGPFQQRYNSPVNEVRDPQNNEILYYAMIVDQ